MDLILHGKTIPKVAYLPVGRTDLIAARVSQLEELIHNRKISKYSVVNMDRTSPLSSRVPGAYNSTHVCVAAWD